jgi:hypothetical protein
MEPEQDEDHGGDVSCICPNRSRCAWEPSVNENGPTLPVVKVKVDMSTIQ